MATLAWHHERLDELAGRVAREAAAKVERIHLMMEREELPYSQQLRTGETYWPYSPWFLSRIIYPKLIADLDALTEGP